MLRDWMDPRDDSPFRYFHLISNEFKPTYWISFFIIITIIIMIMINYNNYFCLRFLSTFSILIAPAIPFLLAVLFTGAWFLFSLEVSIRTRNSNRAHHSILAHYFVQTRDIVIIGSSIHTCFAIRFSFVVLFALATSVCASYLQLSASCFIGVFSSAIRPL